MAGALDLRTAITTSNRIEVRTETVRIVEYSEFPRRVSEESLRLGFTRNISKSGVCLGVDRPEPVGSMLRLGIRDLDGGRVDARIGRVAWASAARDGRHWIGIELLTATSDTAATAPSERLRVESLRPRPRHN